MNDSRDYGPAFDTNVLGAPALRRILGLWMEAARSPIPLLPKVVQELTPEHARGRAALLAETWRWAIDHEDTYLATVVLTDAECERRERFLYQFPLSCFPGCRDVNDLPNHADAIIVAEAAATDASLLLTRDHVSMDHVRINEVVSKLTHRNEPLIAHVDDALNEAHDTYEGGRELLVAALASIWPDESRGKPSLSDVRNRLLSLATAIRDGAGMVITADRVVNLFDHDRNLEQVLERAGESAATSRVLSLERAWRRKLLDSDAKQRPSKSRSEHE